MTGSKPSSTVYITLQSYQRNFMLDGQGLLNN